MSRPSNRYKALQTAAALGRVLAFGPMNRALLLTLVGFAGLGAGVWFAQTRTPAPDESPAAAVARPAPTRLPDIRLADLNGTVRAVAEWSDRPQLINFWATWCAPCRKEMPLLEALHQQQPGIAVIGIAIDREEPVRRFLAETGVTYPILRGEADAMAVAESFGDAFAALPFTVIVSPGGEILQLHTGELTPPQLTTISETLGALAAGQLTAAEAKAALEAG